MTPLELFMRLLDESIAVLGTGEGLQIPDDELHREILVPLLPAMLGDKAIRQHWREQAATGFVARIAAHVEAGAPAPRWLPGDFEIHVTASYLAAPDAKALADTLLSEESLREMTAALMNQVLGAVWPKLPAAEAPRAVPVPPLAAEVLAASVTAPAPAPAKAAPATAVALEGEAFVSAESDEPTAAAQPPEHEFFRSLAPTVQGIQRATKPSPLRGIRHSFGGLADPGWQARNPLKRRMVG